MAKSFGKIKGKIMELRICHLYADLMNIYGDDGNIITLIKRCNWRDIKTEVGQVTIGDKINPGHFDFYFFGGGQDQQQVAVAADLKKTNGKLLTAAAKNGAAIFTVCGGYQLLGHYYQPQVGDKLPGVGLLDTYTVAGNKRMIGNVVVGLDQELRKAIQRTYKNRDPILNFIGFENHSGQTFLGKNVKPLGKVIKGFGNNGEDGTEGAWQGKVFGCYLHGSCLPKNPHFADFLIKLALERRYGKIKFTPLDDSLEWQAHNSMLKKLRVIQQ